MLDFFSWTVSSFLLLLDYLLYWPKKLFEICVDGFIIMLDKLFQDCFGCFSLTHDLLQLGGGVMWALGFVDVNMAIKSITCALIIRFFIRRMPFIG